ncbi:MAG: phage tail protein [Gammaproteobacteria bacterium]|nr:phage tail protein [Gammaproteobacteria bacterium]MDH5651684.1 phage tail protein [Gammaproteobacteria bacterium]
MATYYSLVTNMGLAKLAAANVSGIPLSITEVAIGDGGSPYVAPAVTWTALNNEIPGTRTTVNRVYINPADATMLVVEGFLPKSLGGFTIREVGLYDADGDLVIVASYPDTYKATEAEGGVSDMYLSVMFKHSNTSDVAISTDPSQVLATQKWANSRFRNAAWDLIVGSAAEVLSGEASHAIGDLNDVSVVSGSKVLFLDGTHTLAANLSLSNPDIELIAESSEAIIDAVGFQVTLTGNRTIARLRIINAGTGNVIVSGAGSSFAGIDMVLSDLSSAAGVLSSAAGTNGGSLIDGNRVDAFPSGTRMLFQQSTAPAGWTKDVTHNDKALRIVSGSVVNGGSVAFSTVFSRIATDGHVLSISEIPSHTHGVKVSRSGGGSLLVESTAAGGTETNMPDKASAAGGGGSHLHNIDLRVQYVDVIIASKD